MAIPWIGGLLSSPAGRAGRRRRRRAQSERHEEAPPEEIAATKVRRRYYASFGIGALLISIVIGVVAFGYYKEFYSPPRVWAGSVNNVEFSMGDLVSRIRVLQGVNRYEGGKVDLSTVPFEYLQDLINAEVLRQASPALGIVLTDTDIDAALRSQFGATAAPGQEADPGQLEREYQSNYSAFLTATGLSDGDYRIIAAERLRELANMYRIGSTIESPTNQVEVQWIRLPLERNPQGASVQPEDVIERLSIEGFSVVAQEVSQSGGFSQPDGYVGWVPPKTFPELDPTLYGDPVRGIEALEVGDTSAPIYTSDGIYIIRLLSDPEPQELDPLVRFKLNLELVREWEEQQVKDGSESGVVRMNFNSRVYAWVADQVFVTAPRLPPEQQQPAQPAR